MEEKYSLYGVDGNAFAVVGYVGNAMRSERFPKNAIEAFKKKAMSGDYQTLLGVSLEQVAKVNEFCEFYDEVQTDMGYIAVDKSVAVDFFLRHGTDTDQFRDYVLANGLAGEVEL